MPKPLRIALLIGGVLALALAAGFFLRLPWVTAIWPVPSSRLSDIFVSSILASIGAPIIWLALADEPRAMAGGAIDLALSSFALLGAALLFYRSGGPAALPVFAFFAALLLALNVALFVYSRGLAFDDTRPTPTLVRYSFAGFALALFLAGSALVMVRPNIFPWPLSAENSVFYGFIFLGAMCYFLYGVVYPVWANAKGQLLGFLAYDLVLIVPFLQHFSTVRPEMFVSLAAYTAVVVYSGLLAIYFLFMHRTLRLQFGAESGSDRGRETV
jgi:hypothetical protein